MKTAVFTIASRNYFAHVNTLMQSLEATNPDYERYVVCVDELSADFVALPRNYELISLESLKLPQFKKMAFRYTILEFNTAVKPWAIEKLLKDHERVIYLDPDIRAYRKFTELDALLDGGANFVYTPHLTHMWKADGKQPDEEYIMRAGVYNLGFVALTKSDETLQMVRWWQEKLEYRCVVDISSGVFVDQKFMDLVPGFFDHVAVLHHDGYNVAYWNLSHRTCTKKNGKYFFNGQELAFFHFSGLNVDEMKTVSKHQNRFTFETLGVTRELFEDYATIVRRNSSAVFKSFKYAFNVFADGRPILDGYRSYYRQNPAFDSLCGDDPFARSDIFCKSHAKEVLWWWICDYWQRNPQAQRAFGCIGGAFIREAARMLRFPEGYEELFKDECRDRVVRDPEGPEKTPLDKASGVNLIGYIRSEHGVGQACRHTAEALEKTGLPWTAYDWEVNNASRQTDGTWDAKLSKEFPYRVSIFNINADQMPIAKEQLPKEAWSGYNIGVWYWELPEFPDAWCDRFDLVDEIWAPTRFIADSLAMKAKCPVLYMPPPIEMQMPADASRRQFDLPEKAFLFLTMFDSLSIQARKNPMAAIAAFKRAFSPDDTSVCLVVKINNSGMCANEVAALEKIRGKHANIRFIKETLSRADVNRLIAVSDAVVSLHRSEGLGLLCQEAMCLGKPVVATNWSGNVDFMNNDCACMVDYELKPIGEDIGPYAAWQVWADADVNQASEYMKRLVEDEAYRQRLSAGARRMMERYSSAVCGARMRKRLDEISKVLLSRYGNTHLTAVQVAQIAKGFSVCEGTFVWTEGNWAEIPLRLSKHLVGCPLRVVIEAWPFLGNGQLAAQNVEFLLDGKSFAKRAVSAAGEITLEIPAKAVRAQVLVLGLRLPDAVSPHDLGVSADARKLGLCISCVELVGR